ncbi:hypothetical protein SCOR_01570 [Sulfidibacter corallicola]|uniref:TIGR02270 family protein n=1 Tax=Sulfidibacter corallicola TaxID=2818388 RepID=A0A8A4TGL4_SULCO|nr:hypothetical protein [Sulfidibacter corallicola]QTD48783.1 hypothetical protein J3U87_24645 [Sulfidibacter corallicola]
MSDPNTYTAAERAFAHDLYAEHLEEAAFLYHQRQVSLNDPGHSWRDPRDIEIRLMAHLRALLPGATLIDDVLTAAFQQGEPGEVFAAVAVWCGLDDHARLKEVMAAAMDDESRQAAVEALCRFMPRSATGWLEHTVKGRDGTQVAAAAQIIGFRRASCAVPLSADASPNQEVAPLWKAWALGRLGRKEACPALRAHLAACGEPAGSALLALSLLRLGDAAVLTWCRNRIGTEPWPALALGLAGDASDGTLLRRIAFAQRVDPDSVLALGLLGDPVAIPQMLDLLDATSSDPVAEAASLALYLIAGAPLFEDVGVPEPFDEDELFDDERAKLHQGGEVEGLARHRSSFRRISQDGNLWRAWWREHEDSFTAGRRYRCGALLQPRDLVANLANEILPKQLRALFYEELVIRYGAEIPFETTMYVDDQCTAIEALRQWGEAKIKDFEPGAWYRHGNQVACDQT